MRMLHVSDGTVMVDKSKSETARKLKMGERAASGFLGSLGSK